jgi:hypothetical protein
MSVIVALDGMTGVQLTSGRPSLDHAGRVLVVSGLAAGGTSRLFARRFDQTEAVPVPGTEGVLPGSFAVSPEPVRDSRGRWRRSAPAVRRSPRTSIRRSRGAPKPGAARAAVCRVLLTVLPAVTTLRPSARVRHVREPPP